MKQSEQIKSMTKEELVHAVFLSQLIILTIAIMASYVLFSSFSDWIHLFQWNSEEIFILGGLSGLTIVFINIFLEKVLPSTYLDDGGTNDKIFKKQSFLTIFWITLWIAIAEEALFRGVLQTTFGLIPASIIFVVVHVRYLKKPVLLIVTTCMSFYLGYTYHVTNNLFVPIMIHFMIDFLLGLYLRNKK